MTEQPILKRYVETHPGSMRLADRARKVFPDGVTHDMRHTVPFPLYIERAEGSHKVDVDSNELIDFVMGHGALLLGHGHPRIVDAVKQQLSLGTHYGASHALEIAWGELVNKLVPSADRVRFTSSGTEATMMALRLARRYTGRGLTLRFREHFHGWNDSVIGQPDSESTVPVSPGIPRGMLESSMVLPQNDIDLLDRTFTENGNQIAAAILEPTGAHWGEDPIELEFVRRLRELTGRYGVVLIFDEVITGFRVSAGGAQEAYGITPDLTTLAKIVAGGLPGGCVAGSREILEQISIGRTTDDRIAHPGTFNANPLSSAAGIACLEEIADGSHQSKATEGAQLLARAMNQALNRESVRGCVYGFASMLHIALGPNTPPPDGYSWGGSTAPAIEPTPRDTMLNLRLAMLNEGIDLMGSGLMVSSAHTNEDTDRTVSGFQNALRALKSSGLLPD